MVNIIHSSLLTMIVSVSGTTRSTQYAPQRPWPMTVTSEAYENLGTSGYLAAVLGLLDREEEALASERLKTLYLDWLGTQLALVGEHERATRRGDEAFPRRQPEPSNIDAMESLLASYQPTQAVEAIVAAARERQLVMINEEHRSSRQRAFAHRLLAPLRDIGFTHLAVETLTEDPASLASRGYPVLDSGSYTLDPVFGDLIRRALELGYVVFGYEASSEDLAPRPEDTSPLNRMNRREMGQAKNIFEYTFQQIPDARVLVYAGRDHIAENTDDQWTPMGGILKTLSGIDPLTINQYVMAEHSEREYESWVYAVAEEAGWLGAEPVLLMSEQGVPWSQSPDALDAYLFHPRTRYVQGRPHWMSMGGLRKPIQFECPPANAPILLQAIVKGEADDAIPLDQAIWWPGKPRPALFLRRGTYVLRAIDRKGQVRFSREHQVE